MTDHAAEERIIEELLRLGLLPPEEPHASEGRALIREWLHEAAIDVRARVITPDEGGRRLLMYLDRLVGQRSSAKAAWDAVDGEALMAFVEQVVRETSSAHAARG